jgi:uncharacterized surface protein with fasciclin (FAS1) repeats
MMRVLLFVAFALTATPFSQFVRADDKDVKDVKELKDLVDTAAADKQFSTLVRAVKEAGLVDTLREKGPFTVFAPTNAAFEKIGKEKLEALLADKEMLKKVLMAHVVVGKAVSSADALKMDGKEVNGFLVRVDGEKVSIGDAKVTKADCKATNGVVHVIDTVLMPKE